MNQIKSIRKAADIYKVPKSTLHERLQGIIPRHGSRAKNSLLLQIEEDELVRWILDMDQRGFPPYIIDVKRLAERLIQYRGGSQPLLEIGKH
jgi:hypothetical protein